MVIVEPVALHLLGFYQPKSATGVCRRSRVAGATSVRVPPPGGDGERMARRAVQERGRGVVMAAVTETKERRATVGELERNLGELHQLLMEMAMLVAGGGGGAAPWRREPIGVGQLLRPGWNLAAGDGEDPPEEHLQLDLHRHHPSPYHPPGHRPPYRRPQEEVKK